MRYVTITLAALCGLIVAEAKAGPVENGSGAFCSLIYAEPLAYTVCLGAALTVKEAGGCLLSPEPNQCFGKENAVRQQYEKIIAGPANDLKEGHIGKSKESLWRKAGLPEIRFRWP